MRWETTMLWKGSSLLPNHGVPQLSREGDGYRCPSVGPIDAGCGPRSQRALVQQAARFSRESGADAGPGAPPGRHQGAAAPISQLIRAVQPRVAVHLRPGMEGQAHQRLAAAAALSVERSDARPAPRCAGGSAGGDGDALADLGRRRHKGWRRWPAQVAPRPSMCGEMMAPMGPG